MTKLLLPMIVAAALCTGSAGPQVARPVLRKIVGISAENGSLAVRGNVISLFSDGNIVIDDASSGKKEWAHFEKEPPRSVGVSLSIQGSEWTRIKKNLERSAAYDPPLCDSENQIDVSSAHGRLSAALPKGAKVKAVRDESQGLKDLAVAVYSTWGGRGPYPIEYDVRVALLQSTKSGDYVLNSTDLASEYGMFCGIVQGADKDHWYILEDEPSASSDFLAVYVYAIVR